MEEDENSRGDEEILVGFGEIEGFFEIIEEGEVFSETEVEKDRNRGEKKRKEEAGKIIEIVFEDPQGGEREILENVGERKVVADSEIVNRTVEGLSNKK